MAKGRKDVCPYCGTEFICGYYPKTYCSRSCSNKDMVAVKSLSGRGRKKKENIKGGNENG